MKYFTGENIPIYGSFGLREALFRPAQQHGIGCLNYLGYVCYKIYFIFSAYIGHDSRVHEQAKQSHRAEPEVSPLQAGLQRVLQFTTVSTIKQHDNVTTVIVCSCIILNLC